jgi:hypothetical protein
MSHVTIGAPNECWPWAGAIVRGYGQFAVTSKERVYAHRYAWELEHGPIPDGLTIDHTCHNDADCKGGPSCPHRRCCNPRHCEPLPGPDNLRRSHTWTGHRTHCARAGHPLSGENVYVDAKGGRSCRECRRDAGRRHDRKRRAAGRA